MHKLLEIGNILFKDARHETPEEVSAMRAYHKKKYTKVTEKEQVSCLDVLPEAYDYHKPSMFSRGMKVGNMIFISGTASIDNFGVSIHHDDFEKQTLRTFYNIKKLLETQNASWHDVVKTTIYIKDICKHYDEFNRIRADFFKQEGITTYPASTCVEATMCRPELLIEMEAIAIC